MFSHGCSTRTLTWSQLDALSSPVDAPTTYNIQVKVFYQSLSQTVTSPATTLTVENTVPIVYVSAVPGLRAG